MPFINGGGGAAFNGGMITQPLVIDNTTTTNPLLSVVGADDGPQGRAGASVDRSGQLTVNAETGSGLRVNIANDDPVNSYVLLDSAEDGARFNLNDHYSSTFRICSRGSSARRLLNCGYNASGEIIVGFGSGTVGFYGTVGVAQQTGVAVTAAGIHAALVNLGLITA